MENKAINFLALLPYLLCILLLICGLIVTVINSCSHRFVKPLRRREKQLLKMSLHPSCLPKADVLSLILWRLEYLAGKGDEAIKAALPHPHWMQVCTFPNEFRLELERLLKWPQTRANDCSLNSIADSLERACCLADDGKDEAKRLYDLRVAALRKMLRSGFGYHSHLVERCHSDRIAAMGTVNMLPGERLVLPIEQLAIEGVGTLVVIDGVVYQVVKFYSFIGKKYRWLEAELYCFVRGEVRYLTLEPGLHGVEVYLSHRQLPLTAALANLTKGGERLVIGRDGYFVPDSEEVVEDMGALGLGIDIFNRTMDGDFVICHEDADMIATCTHWCCGDIRIVHVKMPNGLERLTREAKLTVCYRTGDLSVYILSD